MQGSLAILYAQLNSLFRSAIAITPEFVIGLMVFCALYSGGARVARLVESIAGHVTAARVTAE